MGDWTSILFCVQIYIVSLAAEKSNIILILTDDQDVTLGSMTPMKKTIEFIGNEGVTFENAFVTTPICCPSRSSILTGMYLHNHGAINNFYSDGCSNATWQQNMEPRTYGAVLHDEGYRTFYAGKYLNEYGYDRAGGTAYVPPGWDWWVGLVGNSVYYNYTLSVNGTSVSKGGEEQDYLTDVIRDFSLQFLSEGIAGADGFLMAINPPSAHDPYTPARRHEGAFGGVTAPRTPHFNQPSNGTKHWITRLPPDVLPQDTIENIDRAYRNRWETLLAVDEMVEAIVAKLEDLGILDNTYIIFTSDHGFHFGQYGLTLDKRHPYEFDIRVPMLVRGPGVPRNRMVRSPVLSIDIAPTILEMGGAGPLDGHDGESFLQKLSSEVPATRSFLLEYHGEYNGTSGDCFAPLDDNLAWCYSDMSCKCFDMRNNSYSCIRHFSTDSLNDLYCEFDDDEHFVEMYNINADPLEVDNLAVNPQHHTTQGFSRFHQLQTMLQCVKNNILSSKKISECFSQFIV